MKSTLKLCILLLLAGMVGFALSRLAWPNRTYPAPNPVTIHTGLTIQQIQPLSSLVTTRVDVADVQETTINGYTGSMKVAILVKGDFLLGVDLSRARFENVDPEKKTAVLVLPQPIVTSARVDHTRTRVFAITSTGLWQLVPGEEGKPQLINRAYEDAQRVVASAAGDRELIEQARRQAERILGVFFEAVRWNVQIRWSAGMWAGGAPLRCSACFF